VDIPENEQALDFFHGLDQGRYVTFKTSMLNGWATKAFDPPQTVNDIYRITGTWVRPSSKPDGGTAATYATIEEEAKRRAKQEKKTKAEKRKEKERSAAAMATSGETGGNVKGNNDVQKVPKDLSHIECFRCKEKGHYSTSKDCPLHPSKKQDTGGIVNSTWEEEAGMFAMIQEDTQEGSVDMTKGLQPYEVLLDNQANISIVNTKLLRNVRPSTHQVQVKGVGGTQLIVDKVGDLDGFFEVYASDIITANVLCFADVEDRYTVKYQKGKSFMVHLGNGKTVEFARRNKLYVADWSVTGLYVCATVRENEMLYTWDEVRRAKVAYDLIRNSGYPSPIEAVHLIHDGNVRGLPAALTRADTAHKIYGVHPEYVRDQMTNQKVSRARVDLGLRSTDKRLRIYTDVMHIEGQMFVISVTDPLNLTLQTKVQSENRLELGMTLQGHLAALRTRGFEPVIIYTDPHSSFRSMTQDFPGVELDIGGAGDYVSKADAKIRRIKETYRKVKSGLPWELPQQLVGDLVAYCVSRLNIRCTTALAENICPRVLFTGIPVDYRKELTFVFGDYVEAYEGTTNTSRARSSACIALFPAGNSTGMWILWKIDTRTRVRRSNIEKLVMTDRIISMMNMLAEEGQEDQEA
jgi:hypothetical protein